MQLQAVDTIETISSADFRNQYYLPGKPLVIKGAGKELAGLSKMELGFFHRYRGRQGSGVYNNVRAMHILPSIRQTVIWNLAITSARWRRGRFDLRIFLFNIFQHAPQITSDFTWPDELMQGFVKKVPHVVCGWPGIHHTHAFWYRHEPYPAYPVYGAKACFFPFQEQYKLYRNPGSAERGQLRQLQQRLFRLPAFSCRQTGRGLWSDPGTWRHPVHACRLLAPYGIYGCGFCHEPSCDAKQPGWKAERTVEPVWYEGYRHPHEKDRAGWWYNRKKARVYQNAERELAAAEK